MTIIRLIMIKYLGVYSLPHFIRTDDKGTIFWLRLLSLFKGLPVLPSIYVLLWIVVSLLEFTVVSFLVHFLSKPCVISFRLLSRSGMWLWWAFNARESMICITATLLKAHASKFNSFFLSASKSKNSGAREMYCTWLTLYSVLNIDM